MKHLRLKHAVSLVPDRRSFEKGDAYLGLENIGSWTGEYWWAGDPQVDGLVGVFRQGDILFGKLRPYLAKIAAPNGDGVCSTEALILRPNKNAQTDFLRYVLSSRQFVDRVNAATFGSKMPRASWENVGAEEIPLPDLATQRRIADFLDRETARIDLLIEKRRKFADLIGEARRALVAEAITGRLIYDEKTIDGGWLGEIPDHWRLERAKFHFRERQERSETGDEELLTVSHLTGLTRRSDKNVSMFMAESNEGYKFVQPSDVVINTMWAWMGAMGVSSLHGIISPAYGIYHPISNAFIPEFMDLFVRSKPFVAEATRRSKGIHSSRLRLYPDAFLDILLPVPPLRD